MESPKYNNPPENFESMTRRIEQEVINDLEQKLEEAQAALHAHRNTPMWGYAYAHGCTYGSGEDPKLVAIREKDTQLNETIVAIRQQFKTLFDLE